MTFLEWFSKPCDPSADVPIVLAEAAWEAGREELRREHAELLAELARQFDVHSPAGAVLYAASRGIATWKDRQTRTG